MWTFSSSQRSTGVSDIGAGLRCVASDCPLAGSGQDTPREKGHNVTTGDALELESRSGHGFRPRSAASIAAHRGLAAEVLKVLRAIVGGWLRGNPCRVPRPLNRTNKKGRTQSVEKQKPTRVRIGKEAKAIGCLPLPQSAPIGCLPLPYLGKKRDPGGTPSFLSQKVRMRPVMLIYAPS